MRNLRRYGASMKVLSPNAGRLFPVLASVVLAGCASSLGSSGKIDPAKFDAMSCADLNTEIGKTAIAISDAAVRRGKINRFNVPLWVPGGAKAVTALKNRRTTQIERLQAKQKALEAARKLRCR
jgi:outer membrane murein-binding lipoprotein Lpp